MQSPHMSAASLAFRIVYNSFYYFLYLILLAALIGTPLDLMRQAFDVRQYSDMVAVSVCCLATVLIVVFVYVTRLYINRSILSSIPKDYIPIEKGDVPGDVQKMIVRALRRSAAIAYWSRPRISTLMSSRTQGTAASPVLGPASSGRRQRERKSNVSDADFVINLEPCVPMWGDIEHPGWSSSASTDLPNLQYDSVILELPNLVEAKALTLAPQDREAPAELRTLDPEAVALLQRAEHMGIREYLVHLTELGVLAPSQTTADFIVRYEFARFSTRCLTNTQFRELMSYFADVLRNMQPLDPAILEEARAGSVSHDDGSDSSDIDNDAPRGTSPSTLGTRPSEKSVQGNVHREGPIGSRSQLPVVVPRKSSTQTWQYLTAPNTPKSRYSTLSRSSSFNTHMRQPHLASQASSASLRSLSGGSVIRLAMTEDETDLPYVLRPPLVV